MIHLRLPCLYLRKRATMLTRAEEVEAPSLHNVLAVAARRAAFAAAMIIQAPLDQGTELCYQRVAWQSLKMGQHLPRHLRRPKRRDLLRSRTMIGVMALVPQGDLKGILLCIIPETHRTDTHVSMLAEAAHDRRIVMGLLLTLLEVRASHVLRICRRRLHQQKRWRERSFS